MSSKNIDQKLIRDLADILDEKNLTEIEVENDALCVRIARNVMLQESIVTPNKSSPLTEMVETKSQQSSLPSKKEASDKDILTAPLVGVIYFSPSPEAAPFVQVGQNIKEGQTIFIIEAMKVMNQIPAHKSGVVSAILIENSQPVEFGEALAIIK